MPMLSWKNPKEWTIEGNYAMRLHSHGTDVFWEWVRSARNFSSWENRLVPAKQVNWPLPSLLLSDSLCASLPVACVHATMTSVTLWHSLGCPVLNFHPPRLWTSNLYNNSITLSLLWQHVLHSETLCLIYNFLGLSLPIFRHDLKKWQAQVVSWYVIFSCSIFDMNHHFLPNIPLSKQ